MGVKFMTGVIKMGQGKSFEDLVNEKLGKPTVKTASADEEIKTAELSEKQKNLPPALQEAIEKKQTGKTDNEDKDEDKKEDDKDEEKEDEKDCKTAKVAEKDEADSSGQPEAEAKLVNTPEKGKRTKGKSNNDEADSSGQLDVEPLHQKGREASETESFVKLAKLDGKTREFLKKFWGNLYPSDYVDAMLAEY